MYLPQLPSPLHFTSICTHYGVNENSSTPILHTTPKALQLNWVSASTIKSSTIPNQTPSPLIETHANIDSGQERGGLLIGYLTYRA